jgi:predicted SAM-dependent methyltransferase
VDLAPTADVQSDLKALPFEDNYADRIAAIHVIEHFYRWEAEDVLREWMRVLKPGGQLILELPCMDKVFDYIVQCYQQRVPTSPTFSWLPLWGDPKHKDPAMCHRYGYTAAMIVQILRDVGFQDVKYSKATYHFPERDMRITGFKPC